MTLEGKAKSKRARRRAKQKAQKQALRQKQKEIEEKNPEMRDLSTLQYQARLAEAKGKEKDVIQLEVEELAVEYVPAVNLEQESVLQKEEFSRIFEKFLTPQKMRENKLDEVNEDDEDEDEDEEKDIVTTNDEEEEDAEPKLKSKRERRLEGRLKLAELKQLVDNPEFVDIHDCNSSDPKLLVVLKSYRNTVKVPKHWADRRKYLQNKRGIEKPPFELPAFIAATGIGEIRAAQSTQATGKTLKQQQREKMRPKSGRMDIDYQVLHDAFFVNQTKPENMTLHGDLYYEGKEYEAKLKAKRPGQLSSELMRALGMTHGHKSPAPWLFNMQRFGPPPSYPNLKIPGVNWPIPEGCRYGQSEGEWGKPPVDEYGRPLYGDVFGTEHKEEEDGPLEVTFWGELKEDEGDDEDDSSSDESGDDEDEDDDDEEMDADELASGIASTESGISSLSSMASGLSTPDLLNIRKDGTGTETPKEVRSLYTVIDEKKTSVGSGMFGTDKTYVLPTSRSQAEQDMEAKRKQQRGQVNVALNPEELETMDAASLKRKYDAQLQKEAETRSADRAEIDEVYEEEARRKKRKVGKKDKAKYKDFKF